MLGSSLKLSINPTLDEGHTSYYFPAGTWCDVFNRNGTNGCFYTPTGNYVQFTNKIHEFKLHIREGKIVPMQNGTHLAQNFNVSTTEDLQNYPVELHIVPHNISNSETG